MKALQLFLLGICLLAFPIYSQSIQYSYDAAGNRITRILVSKSSFVAQDTGNETTSSVDLLLQKKFQVYFDSVQTDLSMALNNRPHLKHGKIPLFDLQESVLLQQDINSIETILHMENLISGTYVLRLVFAPSQSTWEITKR